MVAPVVTDIGQLFHIDPEPPPPPPDPDVACPDPPPPPGAQAWRKMFVTPGDTTQV
jgi:hypothetical protein